MKSIQIRQNSPIALDDIVGKTNIKVSGTPDEKNEAKKRFVVVSLPNDGSALFNKIRNCIIQPCPPSEIRDAYKRLKPLLQRYAQQTTSKTLEGMPLNGCVSEKTDQERQRKVQFVAETIKQPSGSGIGNQRQADLSVSPVSNMRKLPKSKCPPTPVLEKGLIIPGTFSADALEMKPSTLKSLCEGRCVYHVEPFVQLSSILGCHQNLQQTLNLRKIWLAPLVFLPRRIW